MDAQRRWILRGEALAQLGVKTQTLYAYVSRGRITARPDPENPRRSLYAADDVARLCGSPLPRAADRPVVPFGGAMGRGEAAVESQLAVVAGGRLFYRGMDAAQLSQNATLEDAARLLWDARGDNPFADLRPRVDLAIGSSPRARIFAALARRAQEDPSAVARARPALIRDAASVLNEVVDSVAGPGPRLHLHQRLTRAFKLIERDGHIVRRALVLVADHDLDAATLATRVAAGGGAGPAAAAMAGVATLTAGEHVRRLQAVAAFIASARHDPRGAVRTRLAEGSDIPGFGDPAYPHGDPRTAALLDHADLPPDLVALLSEGEAATGRAASFDLALALTARRLDLSRDGAVDIVIIGRLAGLLGHALDQAQYIEQGGSPIRARLRYVGPEPGAN